MSAAERGPLAELRNRRGERLEFAFHAAASRAVVILAHGVTSNMDRPYLVELGDALARAGISALRFSFAGNGGSEGRFVEATPSKEVDDAAGVVDALHAAGFTKVAYAGHSMGGAVGLLLTARDSRVRALVSLAGMFHVGRFFERHFGKLRPGDPMLGKADCPWSRTLADDAARLGSLHAAAARVRVPWLLVRGDTDEMVPLEDATDAIGASGGAGMNRPELVTLPGADHRFGGAASQVIGAVVPWLTRTLPG